MLFNKLNKFKFYFKKQLIFIGNVKWNSFNSYYNNYLNRYYIIKIIFFGETYSQVDNFTKKFGPIMKLEFLRYAKQSRFKQSDIKKLYVDTHSRYNWIYDDPIRLMHHRPKFTH